jgi:ankyrin repeat protein
MLKWQTRSKKTVVERGATLNDANGYGNTLLTSAAYESNLEVLRYLTELGPDTDIPNYLDDTEHHLAALSDGMDIIKFYCIKDYLLT